MTISIYTLGCRVNQFESLAVRDAAEREGFEIVEWGEKSDIGIVNTCALTQLAESKTRHAVRDFMRHSPSGSVAVTGCMAQTSPKELEQINGVKWIIPNDDKSEIIDIITRFPNGKRPENGRIFDLPKKVDSFRIGSNSPLDDRTNLKIQDGCDNACSYCIIPRSRGIPRSRNICNIMQDAQNLVGRGVREIIITGINIAKYKNPDGRGILDVVDGLANIKGLKRIRFGSVEPSAEVPFKELAKRMADSSHPLMPHLHISAQSFSDKVLIAMRRKETAEQYREIMQSILAICPDAAIGTDLICGHPGEGDSEFEDTKKALRNWGFAYAHVFTFSPREKTLAQKMTAPAPEVARERSDELRRIASAVKEDFVSRRIGTTINVLLENMLSNGLRESHTDNYIETMVYGTPECDNVGGAKNRLAKVKILGEISGVAKAEFVEFLDYKA